MQIYITRNLRVVKVCGKFPEEVNEAYQVLAQFKMVEAGSVWGLDGVAEHVAATHGNFALNKSAISKRQAQKWLKTGKATVIE
jgi:hypothetical protein